MIILVSPNQNKCTSLGGNLEAGTSIIDSSDVSTFGDGDTVVFTGRGFGLAQGSGRLILADSNALATITVYAEQTISAWNDTGITITSVQGGLSDGTVYAWVQHDNGHWSSPHELTLQSLPAAGTFYICCTSGFPGSYSAIGAWDTDSNVWYKYAQTGMTAGVVTGATHGGSLYAATSTNVYLWGGSSWSTVGTLANVIRLFSFGGSLYAVTTGGVYYWNGSSWTAVLLWSTINDACLWGSYIVFGGSFTNKTCSDGGKAYGVAGVDSGGSTSSLKDTLWSGPNLATVNAVAAGSDFYVGGNFLESAFPGHWPLLKRCASGDGSGTWTQIGYDTYSNIVNKSIAYGDSLYVVPSNGATYEVFQDGSSLGTAAGGSALIRNLLFASGKCYIGGSFNTFNSVSSVNIAQAGASSSPFPASSPPGINQMFIGSAVA